MNNLKSWTSGIANNVITIVFCVVLIIVIIGLFSVQEEEGLHGDFSARNGGGKSILAKSDWVELEVYQIDKKMAQKYNLPSGSKGVVVGDIEGNPNVLMKLREGDIITAINNKKIKNLGDFRKTMKSVKAAGGMFCDIKRDGYPMYVTVLGGDPSNVGQAFDFNNARQFSFMEVAPMLESNINIGGIDWDAGIIGKPIEKWIEKHAISDYHACPKCGTMVPKTIRSLGKSISCPNCGTGMISK